MFILRQYKDKHFHTLDAIYRIIPNPDPWTRDGGPLPDSWLVQRATYNAGHHETVREVRTFDEARGYITGDMIGPVFLADRLEDSGRLACRWCDTFKEDVLWFDGQGSVGCRLCRSEVKVMGVTASCSSTT